MVLATNEIILLEVGGLVMAVFLLIYRRLGGYPEANYRIMHTPYIVTQIFEADLAPRRDVHKLSKVKPGSPPMLEFLDKFFILSPENMARDTGRPCWYFNYSDTRPIPLFTWVTGKPIWDPELIKAGFKNKALVEMHSLGRPSMSKIWFFILFGVMIVFVFAVVSAYYSYNAYCGISPQNCGLPR
ncbi:MAG TPA: hypothetical protein VJ327_09835 [Patescibacteria group bacterium]|nr:hypothetical protein [Patescibacteria group bacterium]